ncbi:unnamed protein product [Trichobilharzia szidati]|nr:unnamed protein product [Trichobilharzia szidati]
MESYTVTKTTNHSLIHRGAANTLRNFGSSGKHRRSEKPVISVLSDFHLVSSILDVDIIPWTLRSALVDPFRDERDSGEILFTPIALLLGLSIPIWWPENLKNTDMTVSIGHLCYEMRVKPTSWTGILSIAIGDSFAALVGKAYGKRRWPGSHRTLLGSSASFLTQIIAWTGLSYYYSWPWTSGLLPLLSGVVVEAYTEQIDNLVVPLVVMFTFLYANTNYSSFVYNIIP